MAKNTKTPVMILQELTVKKGYNPPNYEMVYSQQGTHENTFHYSICVQQQQAIGIGKSKKEAKHDAAQKVLELLVNEGIIEEDVVKDVCKMQPEGPEAAFTDLKAPENCIPKLNDLCVEHNIPPVVFNELSVAGEAHAREFTFECKIASITTKATARSKKHAKQKAAKDMLDRIMDLLPQIREEMKQLQVEEGDSDLDVISKHIDKYKYNLNSKPIESEYVITDLMEEKDVDKKDVLKYFELDHNEETLEQLLKVLDAKYELEIIQETPSMLAVNIITEAPLTIMAMGTDYSDAHQNVIKKTFQYLKHFVCAK
ncbi:interferon-inducible double-stranded RNA-dependent protein kinase activator A homolog [Onthophagus taurus]|uniref:interferon-inducible double-stranded RNA-dependent protein kinase activator A homolog n=1 Tax=Onthophagus taurus TaxID=166361 RepID=UPI000C2028C6|nr:interferon-inducible double-stranded RNA-dependent protein kinase activator A homolog [Onthophagus taurus]XP_022906923.1 interferon-inducible double-stranded RNA-dependent protein kinase activator A homolog [Onthophagus taurus]XP_022906924.1 interferon-inducible double-stranded RNA-dependent protein kinase activator A homolog [Onthophagus taurus]